ncbi:MAG: IS110 family transposase [Chloroflexaceae bacterium]|nr:IS110 family transposase [Chloroflexaceae bacterium]
MSALILRPGGAQAETLLVLEATSSYWVALAVHLHKAGYRVAVVNLMHLHNYARSLARRAKTDALYAHLLAQFAAERQPDTWTPPPQVYHELRQRLVTRETLQIAAVFRLSGLLHQRYPGDPQPTQDIEWDECGWPPGLQVTAVHRNHTRSDVAPARPQDRAEFFE